MANPKPSPSRELSPGRPRRSWTNAAALVLGVPLGLVLLALIQSNFPGDDQVSRYVKHGVEWVEVILFTCALAGLGAKLWASRLERAACRMGLLTPWNGEPVAVAEAGKLWSQVRQVRLGLQNTYLVRRIRAILDFVPTIHYL